MIQTEITPGLLAGLKERAKATNYVVLVMNTPNKNNRIYPTDTVVDALAAFKPKLPMFGCHIDNFAPNLTVPLDKVSHKVLDMWIDGDNLMAKIVILNTPHGKFLDITGADFRTAGECMMKPTPGQPGVITISDLKLIAITACELGKGS